MPDSSDSSDTDTGGRSIFLSIVELLGSVRRYSVISLGFGIDVVKLLVDVSSPCFVCHSIFLSFEFIKR